MLIEVRRQGNKDSYVYYYRENGKSRYEIRVNVPEIYTSRPLRKSNVEHALREAKELFAEVDGIQRKGYFIVIGYGPRDKDEIKRNKYEFERVPLEFLEEFDWTPIQFDKKISLDIETGRNGELLCMAIYDGNRIYSYSVDEMPQEKIVAEAAQLIRDIDPLIIYIHNAAFDLEMLRNLGEFKISVDSNEPKIKATVGNFTKMMDVYGRIVIDTYGFSRNYSMSSKKSLEQICEEYGIKYEKKVHNVWKMWDEDRELVKEYNIEDALAHYVLGEEILPIVIKLANFYQTYPGRVCFTSKRKLAIGHLKRKCFGRRGFVPRINEARLKNKRDFVKVNFQQGYFDPAYMLLPALGDTKEEVKAMEATLEVLLNFKDAWWLEKNFGVSKTDLENYLSLLKKPEIVNENFYYFATKKLPGFKCFGECKLLSVDRGKIVGYTNRVFVRGFGINYYPIYTVETLMELADAFFTGNSLEDVIISRREMKIPVEERTIVRTLGKDWYWYTDSAERLAWLKEAIAKKLRKGDKVLKTYEEEEVKQQTFREWLKPYIDLMKKYRSRVLMKQATLF